MVSTFEMILRLFVAAILGSVIGWERERRDWTAGLRTHMMVCLGAALAMLVSEFGFGDVVGSKGIVLDPARVAAQVISGIGFLGAGTIMFLRNEVIKGLTTAAGLWTVAAIGLAAGGGLYIEAVAATLIAFTILIVFKPIENKFFSKNKFKSIRITLLKNQVKFDEIERVLLANNLSYREINLSPSLEDNMDIMKISIQKNLAKKDENVFSVIEALGKIKGVQEVNF
ncbi:MAG TPA: MgtC/SapB family protein [Mucilaginibacter sp.]